MLDEGALAGVARRLGEDQPGAVTQRVAEVRDVERDRGGDRELLAVAQPVEAARVDDASPEVRAQAVARSGAVAVSVVNSAARVPR